MTFLQPEIAYLNNKVFFFDCVVLTKNKSFFLELNTKRIQKIYTTQDGFWANSVLAFENFILMTGRFGSIGLFVYDSFTDWYSELTIPSYSKIFKYFVKSNNRAYLIDMIG